MKGVDSHGCCKNYCENRITASAYMPDNDTTGGYVLHMAVGNGISYVDTCVVSVPINSRQGQKQTSLCRAQERKEIDDYGKNDE